MFAKENVRERERSEGAQSTSDATSDTSRYRYPRRLLSRSIGMPRYSQVPSLLMRTLFSLIVNQSRPQSSSAHDGQEYVRSQKRKPWFRE